MVPPGENGSDEVAGDRSSDPVIRVRGVEKYFRQVHALRGVDFDCVPGEIVAIVGDNGAGKSTLAGVISGIYPPDAGSVEVAGVPLSGSKTKLVHKLGVETVYQNLALCPDLSIAENMFLGRERFKRGPLKPLIHLLDRTAMVGESEKALARVGWDGPSASTLARELSGGQQQAIAVARAMLWARAAILMDEPTAALGARQLQETNRVIRSAAQDGLGVVVITHDIPNMLTYADRVVVMRRGRVVDHCAASDTSVSELVSLMVARDEE